MSTFHFSLTNHKRISLMLKLVVLLFSVSSITRTGAEDAANESVSSPATPAPILFFTLPSLSMTLDVEKEDNALIPFQDQLKTNMELHLEKFYRNKLLTSEVGNPTFVDVDLESQLLWKELWVEPKEHSEETSNEQQQEVSFLKKYEVRGIFNCKIKIQIKPLTTEEEEKPVFMSQSLVNIFFLEAFESEHYWDLMHGFLTTPLLRDIISAEVKVLDVGFVHPYDENNNLRFQSDDDFFVLSIDYNEDAGMMPTVMVAGGVFVVIFLTGLVGIWVFLCIANKGNDRFRWRSKVGRSRARDGDSCKGSSVTSTNSSDSLDSGGEEDSDGDSVSGWASSFSANLDAWASAITSIPVRDVENRRRKKRSNRVVGRPYFRPSNEHSSSLDCITEADNESWCSSVKSNKTSRSAKSRTKRYRSKSRHDNKSSSSLNASDSFDSSSVSSKASTVSDVIYEGDAEDPQSEETEQTSPLLLQRPLVKLMPSEDEDDPSSPNNAWNRERMKFHQFQEI